MVMVLTVTAAAPPPEQAAAATRKAMHAATLPLTADFVTCVIFHPSRPR
jgi:hypothetical protein